MRKVAIESKNSFCTQRSRRMTGNSKLLLSAIYRHLRCKRGGKDEIPHFLIGLAKNLFFILSYALEKKFNMIQFYFWMRDFANSRDGKLIIPDLRRFGIMMPWWKWWLSWKIPIARGMGRWQNHFLNGLTYFSCPWFCDSADHTVVCLFCHFVNWFSQKFNGR